jgi:hypothetical protein
MHGDALTTDLADHIIHNRALSILLNIIDFKYVLDSQASLQTHQGVLALYCHLH